MIHPEHLNTPRLVADATGTTVWRWDQGEPFGNNPADENPSGLGVFDLPLRLPGQYFDKETNLHYNYFRDYDPSVGRYGQSDPIGLRGGLNTYAYVRGRPLAHFDFFGLFDEDDFFGKRKRKPPYTLPPTGDGGGGGKKCKLVRETKISSNPGPLLGWPEFLKVRCDYYCGPTEICPANPEDYIVWVIVEGYELLPGSGICRPWIDN